MKPVSSATLVALLFVGPAQGHAGVQSESVSDDPAVLRAVIKHTILPTHRRTHPNAAEALPLVRASDPLCRQRSQAPEVCRIPDQWQQFLVPNPSHNWPGLVDDPGTRRDLVASFETRNAESRPLPLSAVSGVVIVESRAAQPDGAGGTDSQTPPFGRLSLPGYSAEGYAMVSGSYSCGGLCGYGWLFVLRKDSGQWRVLSATVTAIS